MNVRFYLGQLKKRAVQKIFSYFEALCFLINKPLDKTVLLIEGNNSHTELLPSFVKYLNKMSYNVEIAVRIEQKSFLPPLDVKKIYYFNIPGMKLFLKFKKVKEYEAIIFTSYRLYYPTPDKKELQSKVSEHFKIKYPPKLGITQVLHHIEDYDKYCEKGSVVLSKILKKNENLYVVNPCYFIDNNIKNKNKKTVFAITGALIGVRKNPDLLFSAAEKLLHSGIDNFEIKVIGDNNPDFVPLNLRKVIKIKGKLNFRDLYNELVTSDFYLPLLDPDSKEHKRYITTGTSGSFQLIRGFLLPPVINQLFAFHHGFNDKNSITYDKNEEFYLGIKRAINMNNEEYLALQKELLIQRDGIIKNSCENLKSLLDSLIRG